MADDSFRTTQLHALQARIVAGEPSARDELLRHVCGRLERLARKMLRGFPGLKRWVQTDDVLQNAAMRLLRALEAVRPDSVPAFFALAARQIRRELLDLTRHFFGPHGLAANQASNGPAGSLGAGPRDRPDDSWDPARLAEWREFHEQIDQLPEEERQVVDLLFYQGLKQAEAAGLLGVTVRTVQRRWQAAILRLHDRLGGERPGE